MCVQGWVRRCCAQAKTGKLRAQQKTSFGEPLFSEHATWPWFLFSENQVIVAVIVKQFNANLLLLNVVILEY